MVKTKTTMWLFLAVCGLVLMAGPGCAKKAKTAEKGIAGPVEHVTAPREAIPDQRASIQEFETAGRKLNLEDVFFDFDRSQIRPDARRILDENARWLKDNPRARIIIQGHADERGTTEYNLVLGERRAQAAKQYLISLGVEPHRIRTITYGEEKPFCSESSERCWQQNRRGHFAMSQ